MRIGLGIGLSRARGGQAAGPANTVAPVISGTAERGEVLSCTTGTWTGTGTITYAYQWLRDGAEIAGATSSTYTLVTADDNANIRCRATATDDKGSRSAFSNTLGPVLGAPLNLAAPVLSGTETVQELLSVTDGTWQGVAPISFGYQWRRDGVAILGATSNTYTLVAADYGAVISCDVPATNSLGTATAQSNDTGAIAGLAPTNSVAPSIAGTNGLGDTLTRTAGTWTGTPTPSVTGQWRRDGVAIAGETGATYTIVQADSGAVIDYLETATNAEGTATQDSNDITAQTFAAPTIGAGLSIAGTEEVGETLTATAAAVTGNPTPVRTWQWQRSEDGSTGWADIAGATASTYTLVAADETKYVRVKQIETNALGSDEAVSAATGEIQAGGATGILDSYTGAAFAFAPDTLIYGTHSVEDTAVGSVTNGSTDAYTVRVRRSSDNAVSSFTYSEVSDGTLVTWVGVGNDGFVEAAYDQSGNDNHATQSTAANQPKIVDAGVLVVENGKAALDFDGINHFLVIQSSLSYFNFMHNGTKFLDCFVFSHNKNSRGEIIGNISSSISKGVVYSVPIDNNNNIRTLNSEGVARVGSLNATTGSLVSNNTQYILTHVSDNANPTASERDEIYLNDGSAIKNNTITLAPSTNNSNEKLTIGSRYSTAVTPYRGTIQLINIWPNDFSLSRVNIRNLINNEYNIY